MRSSLAQRPVVTMYSLAWSHEIAVEQRVSGFTGKSLGSVRTCLNSCLLRQYPRHFRGNKDNHPSHSSEK